MNGESVILLYTADVEFGRRLRAYGAPVAPVLVVSDATDLHRRLAQHADALLLFDLRAQTPRDTLAQLVDEHPNMLVIALGTPRSDPMLDAMALNIFAAMTLEVEAVELQMVLRQAVHHLGVVQERDFLQRRQHPTAVPPAALRPARDSSQRFRQFIAPLRHFDNLESLLQGIVDGIASAAVVLRAGIFAFSDAQQAYRLHAGVGCLDETRALLFRRDAPLVRWLEINALVVNRAALDHIQDSADRLRLQRTLDTFGAELIIPLHGRSRMLGWLFLGRRATGAPFDEGDLQDVMLFGEHIATSLENALLYREVAVQKRFAETLLGSLPTGVVAISDDGCVQWINPAACAILDIARDNVNECPVETLGTRIATPLRECLGGNGVDTHDWFDEQTQRHLSLRTVRLPGEHAAGAVGFITDRTREQLLNRRQQELERAGFWTELAASMSHEIRNPMVAIKTFAQLLPEQYADPEFRTEFSGLMSREVDRLDAIIQQINSFASRPLLTMDWVSLREVVEEAMSLANLRAPPGDPTIEIHIDNQIPPVRGDRRALVEGFAHVLVNAMEALYQKPSPRITVTADTADAGNGAIESVSICIEDNAGGIESSIRDNVFSPFCTTKARAMGLGLPIVQRTIADHNGHVAVEPGAAGTCVRITLPVSTAVGEMTA